jgi:NAD(P)-dependent dehydrogenase (short-subunit alcohol dehydrogenase family)
MEIQPFGLRSICIEPGYFRTNLIAPDNRKPYVNKIKGMSYACNFPPTSTGLNPRMLRLPRDYRRR